VPIPAHTQQPRLKRQYLRAHSENEKANIQAPSARHKS
jgi:hypothetical protein